MAADQTATRRAHGSLAAATARKVRLTESGGNFEVVNRGTVEIFVRSNITEAALVAATVGTNEEEIVLPGERMTLSSRATGAELWVSLISSGTPNYSVLATG